MGKTEEEYQKMLNGREPAGQGRGQERIAMLNVLWVKFEEAQKMFEHAVGFSKMIGQRVWESASHFKIAAVYSASGNNEKILEESEETLMIARELENLVILRSILLIIGIALLKNKNLDETQRTTDELNVVVSEGLLLKTLVSVGRYTFFIFMYFYRGRPISPPQQEKREINSAHASLKLLQSLSKLGLVCKGDILKIIHPGTHHKLCD